MTGHLLEGAGALGAIVTLQALRTEFLPGTMNLENPDPEIDLNLSSTTTGCAGSAAAITNAFGLGGNRTALVITTALEAPGRAEVRGELGRGTVHHTLVST